MKVQELTFPSSTHTDWNTEIPADGFDAMKQDIKVIALVKGQEQYVFMYNEENRAETLRTLGRYASSPELSFTWYDAAVLSQKIRQESLQQARNAQLAEQPQQEPPQGRTIPVDELF